METLNKKELDIKIQSLKKGFEDLENLIIKDYNFHNIKFECVGLRNNVFENCIFDTIIFESVFFDNSIFKNCEFKNCEFQFIDFGLYEVVFENTVFYQTNYYKTDSLSSSYLTVTFNKCNFRYFDVSSNFFKNCKIIDSDVSGLIYSPKDFDNNVLISET